MQSMVIDRQILPEPIFSFLHSDKIKIFEENGNVVLSPLKNEQLTSDKKRRAVKSLDERFEGYTGNYQCFEADTGNPVGLEAW